MSRRGISCFLSVVLYLVGALVIIKLSFPVVNWMIENGWIRHAVSDIDTVYPFPIAVSERGASGLLKGSAIVYGKDLKRYQTENPGNLYTLPGYSWDVRGVHVLYESTNVAQGIEAPVGRIRMKRLPNGNQAFHVIVTFETDERGRYTFVSWYEATPISITPQYYSWHRESNTFAALGPLIVMGYTVLWSLVPWGYRVVRRKRRQHQGESNGIT